MKFDDILKDGECFYKQHSRLTLFEIKSVISLLKVSKTLPNCFWEDIQDIHATNYSTMISLFNRLVDANYPNTIGVFKPSILFFEWLYKGMTT